MTNNKMHLSGPNTFKIVILFKLAILFVFSSEYSGVLFHPFVSSFAHNPLQNPWQFYLTNNLNLDAFPYHPVMLLILCPFAILSDLCGLAGIFKLPLLLADVGIFYALVKSFPHRVKNIYLFYFLNPIIIYATYVHSQLDIIPTALLLLGIYLIIKNKYTFSAILFGLALATKTHIVIALPLVFFYLYKTENIKLAFKCIALTLATFLVFDLPFLFSEGFTKMVLMNPKQSLLFDSFYTIGTVRILLPIAAMSIIYVSFFNQNKVNRDLLYFYFGILFTATIFFIYSGPAWYVWMIPFVSIYFIQSSNKTSKNLFIYMGFSVFYLVFFLFFYQSDYQDILVFGKYVDLKIPNSRLADISFTFLEVTLLAIMYSFYKYGIKSNSIYKKQTNLIIGIGGDSGVGKTTLVKNLQHILGNRLLQIEGDGEHKWERNHENWSKFTHLDPKANYIHKQSDAIYSLKHHETIYRSEYEHSKGQFTEPRKIKPKEFIVIAGLHPFYLPKLRKNIDFKIYIDTDEKLRRHWKIIRDTRKRGYSMEKILGQIEARKDDAIKYIYPQKGFADMVVKYFAVNDFQLGNAEEETSLGLKITFDANIHIEDILTKLNCEFVWDYNDDLKSQYIEFTSVPQVNFEDLAIDFIENIHEIIAPDARWDAGYEGMVQFISLKMISEKLKGTTDEV